MNDFKLNVPDLYMFGDEISAHCIPYYQISVVLCNFCPFQWCSILAIVDDFSVLADLNLAVL